MVKKTRKKTESQIQNKKDSLNKTLACLEKDYGKGSIGKFSDRPVEDISAISTGSISIDSAIGVGGVPRGRVVEVFGPESSGKTTLALGMIAEAQKNGGTAAFIDIEHALDPSHARGIGVNLDELIFSQPDSGEQALNMVEQLAKCGDVDIIIVDSVAALTPQKELEGDIGDQFVGQQARLMGQAMRKITPTLSDNTAVVFINQLREKVGVMFGSPEVTPGGKALKFYSSVRLDLRRIAAMKDGDKNIGNRVKVKVVKNKVGPPFKVCEVDLIFGQGFSKVNNVLDLCVEYGFIEKSGAWFKYEGQNIGQGKEATRAWLLDPANEEILEELDYKCRVAIGLLEGEVEAEPNPKKKEAKAEEEVVVGE